MKWPSYGDLFRALAKAYGDVKANTPPSKPPTTGASLAADIAKLEAILPKIRAALAEHPGLITGADDILDVFAAQDDEWAADLETVLDDAPMALQSASGWFPWLASAVNAFSTSNDEAYRSPHRIGR